MPAAKTDVQIQKQVLAELLWDTRVKATDVGVEVENGVVTLTGTVDSYAKQLAAREAAHRVAGVLDVADDIRVVPPASGQHTDTDIAEAVRHALTWDVFVPEEQIRSTVTNGYVTLTGDVTHFSQRDDAERAVRALHGVKNVFNEIVVKSTAVEAQAVRGAIERALERRAEREARQVAVQVSDGTVTLSGTVSTYPERRAVFEAASHAPGVRSVVDELRMNPSV